MRLSRDWILCSRLRTGCRRHRGHPGYGSRREEAGHEGAEGVVVADRDDVAFGGGDREDARFGGLRGLGGVEEQLSGAVPEVAGTVGETRELHLAAAPAPSRRERTARFAADEEAGAGRVGEVRRERLGEGGGFGGWGGRPGGGT